MDSPFEQMDASLFPVEVAPRPFRWLWAELPELQLEFPQEPLAEPVALQAVVEAEASALSAEATLQSYPTVVLVEPAPAEEPAPSA